MSTSESQGAWKEYKKKKIFVRVIILLIVGLVWFGREFYKERKLAHAVKIRNEREMEKAKSPSKNDYYILKNRYRDAILKVSELNIDSVEFVLCKPIVDYRIKEWGRRDRWALSKLHHTCRDTIKELSISREDLLKTNCKNKDFCHIVAELDDKDPFKVLGIVRFNGVELNIINTLNTFTSERKTISLENFGLPIIIKEIHPLEGPDVKLVNSTLPYKLKTNSKLKLDVPLVQGFLPNTSYTEYMPYDFNILVESESNGEELYRVSFEDEDSKVNFDNLVSR